MGGWSRASRSRRRCAGSAGRSSGCRCWSAGGSAPICRSAAGLLRVYLAELAPDAPEPRPLEHAELRWVGPDELAEIDWVDVDRAVVADLAAQLGRPAAAPESGCRGRDRAKTRWITARPRLSLVIEVEQPGGVARMRRAFAMASGSRRGNRRRAGPVQAGMSIDSILRRQGGVISRQQATAAGLTPGAVDDRVRRRRWRPLYPQVYLVAAGPADAEVRVRAALLWAGEGAVLAGAAAAWWCGLLPQPPTTITVAVPRHPPRGAARGSCCGSRELAPADLAEHRGLRVTARPLTVLETAVELGAAGAALLDRALQSWLPFPDLHAAYRRNPSTARPPGAGRRRGAIGDGGPAAARCGCCRLRQPARLVRAGRAGGPSW